jgi:hypothetical protein
MSNIIVKTTIHRLFAITSRTKADARCVVIAESYKALVDGLPAEALRTPVKVPKMRGIDENMREWSILDVLEHNTIVNRSITAIVCQLANDEPLSGPATIDPKDGVMPTGSVDEGILETFLESIESHRKRVAALKTLRGSRTSNHPVFGPFDAHKWNCMFPFHLGLHLNQVKFIAERLSN